MPPRADGVGSIDGAETEVLEYGVQKDPGPRQLLMYVKSCIKSPIKSGDTPPSKR